MTERLTRAQRRKLEKETRQKINLDDLAELDVKAVEKNKPVTKEIEENETPVKEKNSSDKETEKIKEESSSLSEEESDEDSEDDNEEDSEEDSEDESDSEEEEDLDELLKKAEKALQNQTPSIQLEETKKPLSTKISKMNIGIAVDKELYFKTHTGRSKLVTEAVELINPGEKPSKKATVALKPSKDEDAKKLNKKERQLEREKTAGSAWFDMPKPEITPEIKRDLQVLKMRHILDRKRHYKKMGNRPDPKYFQIGTIIESPTEFYSARMNKKDRKQTIIEELMANDDQKQYYKRKYNEVQERSNSGGKKHFKKLKAQRQWAK